MTVVQNTAADPAGNAPLPFNVRVTLITGSPNTPGYTASGDIIGTASVPTDQTGHWSINLAPNSTITPANTYYQVVEGQAVSTIVVPATGGPYSLSQVLATPPPTPAAPGITGVAVAAGGTLAGTRPEVNLIAGSGVTVTAADNPSANRVDVTVSSSGGYKPWQFYVGTYGAVGDDTTDDTAAFRAAIAAGFNYAVAHNGYMEIVLDPLTYLLSSAPITGATFNGATFEGSAQLPIPAQAQAAEHIVVAFVCTRDQTALYNWQQTVPQRAGAVLRSTYAAGATIPTTGEASVVGGPTPHFLGDPPSSWSNVHVVVDGVSIEVPTNPQICGWDFRCMGSANVKNAGVLALSASTGAPQIPDPNWAFGLAMPIAGNNDECNIDNYSCEGLVIGLQVYEHVQGSNVRLINCYDGLVCFSSSGFPHRNHFDYVSIENCVNLVVLNGGFNKLDIDTLDIEWGTGAIVKDASASPALGRIGITSNGNSGATLNTAMNSGGTAVTVVNGAIALEVTNLDQSLGPVTPPGIPGNNTALVNPFWREAAVAVAGGTVTAIKIDGVATGLTAGTVIVPPGHSITLTYSAAPSWTWTLTR